MKRKALGRGLSAILSDTKNPAPASDKSVEPAKSDSGIHELSITQIKTNPYQPRDRFDEERLSELSASIKQQGVLQPIIVRKNNSQDTGEFPYELIAGERRLRASKMAGRSTIPGIVLEADDEKMLEVALVENVQRSDLNPLEEAKAYQKFTDIFKMTQNEIAEKVGKSRSTVANSLRLLELPQVAREALSRGEITTGHAKCLLSLDKENAIETLLDAIIQNQLSVRETEKRIQEQKKPSPKEENVKPVDHIREEDMHVAQLRRSLEDRWQTKVNIKMKGKQQGKIEISFHDLDQLDSLLKKWGVSVH